MELALQLSKERSQYMMGLRNCVLSVQRKQNAKLNKKKKRWALLGNALRPQVESITCHCVYIVQFWCLHLKKDLQLREGPILREVSRGEKFW